MNPKLKQKWVDALRSGRFRQTHGQLKARNGACCCLGVLCQISGVQWVWRSDHGEPAYFAGDENRNYLPRQLAQEIGLNRTCQTDLALMNDGDDIQDIRPHSFAEIADYIEENL